MPIENIYLEVSLMPSMYSSLMAQPQKALHKVTRLCIKVFRALSGRLNLFSWRLYIYATKVHNARYHFLLSSTMTCYDRL